MKSNHKRSWEQLRDQVFRADGNACIRCGKSANEGAILQVHHKSYINGRDYWDYPLSMLETLCKGCHAREHQIIPPDTGWSLIGDEDLGSTVGACGYCGHPLRYLFHIQHPHWRALEVGHDCCDLLTEAKPASLRMKDYRKQNERKKRFLAWGNWELEEGGAWTNRLGYYRVRLVKTAEGWRVFLNGRRAKTAHLDSAGAKSAAFDFIESGKAREWFSRKT